MAGRKADLVDLDRHDTNPSGRVEDADQASL
jgi:hypothetical protein